MPGWIGRLARRSHAGRERVAASGVLGRGEFLHFGLDAQASDLKTGSQYSGSAAISGFLAAKHASFISRKRFSFGMSFGGGVGPQLTAQYRQTYSDGGALASLKTCTLNAVPVTPLFEVLFRGDVRVQRNLSIGPNAGE